MKTRGALVAFPGNPFSLQALRPNARLALMAGALERSGHPATILDYGTVETLDRLYSSLFRRSANRVSDAVFAGLGPQPLSALGALWELRGMRRSLRAEMGRLLDEASRTIASLPAVGFVVFHLAAPDDIPAAVHMAKRVRAACAGVRVAATGPLVEWTGSSVSSLRKHFDALFSMDAEREAVRFADGQPLTQPRAEEPWLLDSLPRPAYYPETYGALERQTKLRLFELECSRDRVQPSYVDAATTSYARSAEAVGDEIQYLVEGYGARAFCLTGRNAPFAHMEEVAHELQARGLGIRYSRTGTIHNPRGVSFAAPVFARMKLSGCRAMDFELNTGSQWMLDDYYKRDFGISETEHILRACKSAGLFTVEHFLYPAPADDYHSRAETVRLISRTLPDSVQVEVPWALPPAAYEAKNYARDPHRTAWIDQVMKRKAEWPSLDSGIRWMPSQVAREHASLLRELEGLSIDTTMTAETALVARVSGYEGREQDFGMLMLRHFFAGDATSIAAVVERFNHRMDVLGHTEARKAARPLLAAVGN